MIVEHRGHSFQSITQCNLKKPDIHIYILLSYEKHTHTLRIYMKQPGLESENVFIPLFRTIEDSVNIQYLTNLYRCNGRNH